MMYKILREKIMEEEEVNSSDGSLEKIKNETEYENNDTDSSSTANPGAGYARRPESLAPAEFPQASGLGWSRLRSCC